MLQFTGERIVPEAENCEPNFAQKMYQEHSARYFFASQFCAGKTVLDVGCGVGYGSKLLAGWGASSVVGIDLSEEAVRHARSFYTHPNVRFEVGSATQWSSDDRFDVVTCFELIEHVLDQDAVLAMIKAHLKPDGVVVMSTPRPLETMRSAFHEKELNFYEFRDLLSGSFRHVRPFYENNHLVSIVTDGQPEAIERIHPVVPSGSLVTADYFVLVASDGELPEITEIRTSMALNDDSYVLLLEKDVGILKGSEEHLRREIETLKIAADGHDAASQDVALALAERDEVRQEIARTVAARDAARQEIEHFLEERDAARREISLVVAERDEAREEVVRSVAARGLAQQEIALAVAARDAAEQEMARAIGERDVARQEVALIGAERDEARQANTHAVLAHDAARQEMALITTERDEARQEIATLRECAKTEVLQRAEFEREIHTLTVRLEQSSVREEALRKELKDALDASKRLETRRQELANERVASKQRFTSLLAGLQTSQRVSHPDPDPLSTQIARAVLMREQHFVDERRYRSRLAAQNIEEVRKLTHKKASPRFSSALARYLESSGAFERGDYLQRYPDVSVSEEESLVHYIEFGRKEARDPHTLFDTTWYYQTNPDVLRSGTEPLSHYLRNGSREGRNPNPVFNGAWYAQAYADRIEGELNPFVHYIQQGAAKGLWPNPLFDPAWYREAHSIGDPRPWGALAHYLTDGRFAGLRPNPLFDPVDYVRLNPDILSSNQDPLTHYVEHGGAEMRPPSWDFDPAAYCAQAPEARTYPGGPLAHFLHEGRGRGLSASSLPSHASVWTEKANHGRIAIVFDPDRGDHPTRRWDRMVDTLREESFAALAVPLPHVPAKLDALRDADAIILADLRWSSDVERLVETCRAAGITLIFDTDGATLDPAVINTHTIATLTRQSGSELARFYDDVLNRFRLATACDAAFGATQAIVSSLETIGLQTYLVPTPIAPRPIDPPAPVGRSGLVIGVFAGSNGAEAVAALVPLITTLLSDDHSARLTLIGAQDRALWQNSPVSRRVTILPVGPGTTLTDACAGTDFVIAPGQPNDPLHESEEASIYVAAALASVPVIATPTAPFAQAMLDGWTGRLVDTPDAWRAAIDAMIGDPDARRLMGQRARSDVIDFHAPQRSLALVEAVSAVIAERRLAARGAASPARRPPPRAKANGPARPGAMRRSLRICWIVPGLIIGGGGHRNILRTAHHLRAFGHDVSLMFEHTRERPERLKELVNEHFYPFDGPVYGYDETSRGEDVVFATHWSTVSSALRLRPQPTEIMYFVQDFEPMFCAMGSDYIFAENTYRKDLYAITSGPWCERFLRRDFGMEADHFRFPIDREIYHLRPQIARENRIAFFAKPEMPRRCYEIGVEALRQFHHRNPDTEIVFFGSREARAMGVDFPVTYRDVLPSITDLAELYASSRLGIAFSTTNPSLVPYEMMACGLPVLDLGRPDNDVNYGERTDIAFLADPDPGAMAQQIGQLLRDDAQLSQRAEKGVAFAAEFPTEIEMVRRVEDLILRRLDRTRSR